MFKRYKKVYISGIGGIGVSAIARLFVQNKVLVLGSDLSKSIVTEELEKIGVKIFYEQKAENIIADIDLLIFSPAVPETNPERVRARELNIEQKSYPQMLGLLSNEYQTIAVSGTNGKSTTTAMLGNILMNANLDPMIILGSRFPKIEGNFRPGTGKHFVVEACEYRAHMLEINPWAIVLTNLEAEHLDYYRDLDHIIETFEKFVNKLSAPENILVLNNDDPGCLTLKNKIKDLKATLFTYGMESEADVKALNLKVEHGLQTFEVNFRGVNLGQFELQIPGKFNVYNALAAISLALALEIKTEIIKESLAEYCGIWRRFEKIYDKEITVISDYAHHPTGVRETLIAAKEFYPGRRLVCVFQPHQHNRTKMLFNDFVQSFDAAEVVVIPEISYIAGREDKDDQNVSSKDLVVAISERNPEQHVMYAPDLEQTLKLVNGLIRKDDVVVAMGAADLYLIADKIKLNEK